MSEAPVREFLSGFTVSGDIPTLVEIAKNLVESEPYGVFNILKHLPDAVVVSPYKIEEGAPIDILGRFRSVYVHTSFASPLFEFWHGYAENMADKKSRSVYWQTRESVLRLSRSSWWKKLLWNLGGFQVPTYKEVCDE